MRGQQRLLLSATSCYYNFGVAIYEPAMDRALEPLDISEPEGLEAWHERFDCYTNTNEKITATNKLSWYLTLIGKDAYNLLKDLVFPDSLSSSKIDDLKSKLSSHLRPTSFELTERARFHNLVRRSDETCRNFLLRLQRQAAKCSFGADLKTQMRDRIVAGIQDKDLQKRLLRETALTYDTAREILET